MLTGDQLKIIKFCSEEVGRQGAEPIAVYWMCRAWAYAQECAASRKYPTLLDLAHLGKLIEPVLNRDGFRSVKVWVGETECPPPLAVIPLLQGFVADLPQMMPDEAYLAFVGVHPFRDGNGRCAKILLGWISGRLDTPEGLEIPNPWGIANP